MRLPQPPPHVELKPFVMSETNPNPALDSVCHGPSAMANVLLHAAHHDLLSRGEDPEKVEAALMAGNLAVRVEVAATGGPVPSGVALPLSHVASRASLVVDRDTLSLHHYGSLWPSMYSTTMGFERNGEVWTPTSVTILNPNTEKHVQTDIGDPMRIYSGRESGQELQDPIIRASQFMHHGVSTLQQAVWLTGGGDLSTPSYTIDVTSARL